MAQSKAGLLQSCPLSDANSAMWQAALTFMCWEKLPWSHKVLPAEDSFSSFLGMWVSFWYRIRCCYQIMPSTSTAQPSYPTCKCSFLLSYCSSFPTGQTAGSADLMPAASGKPCEPTEILGHLNDSSLA